MDIKKKSSTFGKLILSLWCESQVSSTNLAEQFWTEESKLYEFQIYMFFIPRILEKSFTFKL